MVKDKLETRKNLRKARRYRKTPYRKCRVNRTRNENWIPSSTKARWDAKLRFIRVLKRILPLTDINVEDIKAISKPGKTRWNASFSPLEAGKKYFYAEVIKIVSNLVLTSGYETFNHRLVRNFHKSKKKLLDIWEAHNVDSHSLCEMIIGNIKPVKKILRLNFFNFFRRQLYVQLPNKGGIRKNYGSTRSLGITRGSLVKVLNNKKYKNYYYVGGSSEGRISIHDKNNIRIAQNIKVKDIKIICKNSWLIK